MARFKKASDIRVGVVGYGGAFNMGKWHLLEMQKAGMTPVAVAEIDPKRLDAAKTDFPGIGTFDSLGTMLKKSDVNLITIITPHNTHAKLAVQALKAGRHVVCEKPLAITTAECDAMISAAKAKNLVLSTYHNRHWDGCILEAAERIGSGVIGPVHRVEILMGGFGKPGDWWRSSKSISGGVLYDWGVHLLEYSLQIVKSDIVEVSGFAVRGVWASQSVWKNDLNEDEAAAIVRFKGGASLTLRMSQIDMRPHQGWVVFTGSKGVYVMNGGDYEIYLREGNETVVRRGPNCGGEGWKFYQNVADHLAKGEKLIITGEWARRPIHILDLACRSAELGRALPAKYK